MAALRENRPLRIGVLGDSFGDGIWAVTNQNFLGKKNFAVSKWSKEGIGFTRYRSLNLLDDAKARFADQPIDIAIIDFGANDTQGVWDGGHGSAYMAPGWQKVIGGRAEALVSYLQGEGVAVAWIGLPRMRKPDYDSQVQAMNGFYKGLMCRLHVPFTDPVKNSEDKDHHFSKELIDPATNKSYNARAEDGIHMTFHGYSVIARPVWQRIEALAAQSGVAQSGSPALFSPVRRNEGAARHAQTLARRYGPPHAGTAAGRKARAAPSAADTRRHAAGHLRLWADDLQSAAGHLCLAGGPAAARHPGGAGRDDQADAGPVAQSCRHRLLSGQAALCHRLGAAALDRADR
jgi:hypothetical protein